MQKITVKELVDFTRKLTDKGKRNFAYKLKHRELKKKAEDAEDEGGGDYWVTSTSCIYNVIKHDQTDFYDDKLDGLAVKLEGTEDVRIKAMYQRNIDILISFKDFNHTEVGPAKILKFETVQKVHKVLSIDNFPLYINPSLVFSHERNGKKELGAIWLVPKLYGFKKVELGMFCELLHKFLTKNYSDNYQISEDLCIAIDTFGAQKVAYEDLLSGKIPFMIQKTVAEIKLLE